MSGEGPQLSRLQTWYTHMEAPSSLRQEEGPTALVIDRIILGMSGSGYNKYVFPIKPPLTPLGRFMQPRQPLQPCIQIDLQGQQHQVDHDGVIALEALLHATMSLGGERTTALAGCANLAERLGDIVQRSLGLRQRVRPAVQDGADVGGDVFRTEAHLLGGPPPPRHLFAPQRASCRACPDDALARTVCLAR